MSMSEILRGVMSAKKPEARTAALDSASDPAGNSPAGDFAMRDIAMAASAAIQQWAETDDLDGGETHADRLLASNR